MTQQGVDELHVELSRKEDALVLAASYGKSLLEENERVKHELQTAQQEYKHLEKFLQSQKQDAQRTLVQARTKADEYISDLEYQLKCTKNSLDEEQNNFASTREDLLKAIDDLQLQNSELRAELNKLTIERSIESEKCLQVRKALKEFEGQGQSSSVEYEQLQKLVESLQDSNKSYSTNVSTLAHTCDKLSDDLQVTRSQMEYWERQYTQLNEEYHCRGKELEDSQDLIRQLQIQVDQQRESMMTPYSGMSLHDELSQSNSSLHMLRLTPDDLSSPELDDSDQITMDHIVQACAETRPSLTDTLRMSDHPQALLAWSPDSESSDYLCHRCKELGEQVTGYKQELKSVNELLLIAVEQKFKLQQQNLEWESDMAEVVDKQLHHKLHGEKGSTKKRKDKPKAIKHKKRQTDSDNSDDEHGLNYHFIKDSWLF